MHFLRALTYFNCLKSFGDYPIITEVLPDDAQVLIEKSKREPRNRVARFILSELDKAIDKLHPQGFESNNRINKETALLFKSRVALYEASLKGIIKERDVCQVMRNGPEKQCIRNSL